MSPRVPLGATRARPGHVLAAAALAGLLLGPRAPWALVPAALVLPALCARGPHALAALALLAGGALAADARLAALAPPSAPAGTQPVAGAPATLLERPRTAVGGWRAEATLGGERVLLRGRGSPPAVLAGEIVRVRAALRPPGPHERWLRARHVGRVAEGVRLARTGGRRGGPAGVLDRVRGRALAALERGLPADAAALLQGMTLGDDAALSPAARADLRAAGLGHLVAASGANIALLAVLAGALAAALGLPRRARIALVLALIAVYVPLAGSGPSIQRAGVMGAATLVAALASRPALRWHALLLAAVATLAWDPRAVEAPGWQLSFAAVAAIALLAAPLRDAMERRRVPRPAAEAAALTAAATLGTAPVSAAVFGTVALAGLPANLAAAALVAPITWLGLLGTLAAQAGPAAAWPFTAAAALPLGLLLEIARAAAALPGARAAPSPVLAAGACAGAALLIVHAPLRRRLLPHAPPVLAALLLAALVVRDPRPGPPPPPPGTLRVTLLDVGQGDATLLQAGGRAVLVDAGPPGGAAARGLRRAGVRALDLLVGTHAQADHVGGADEVLRALPVAAVLDGRDGVRETQGDQLAAAAAERRARLLQPLAGQRLHVGPLLLEVLWPPPSPPVPGADPNDRAIVLRASAYGARVLLTADAESGVLGPLAPGPADVLKVSHHGSVDPGLPALLRTVRPRAALIGVGRGNPYGHPAPQALAALGEAGVPVLRTDRDGSVRLDLRGGGVHVQPHS